MKRKTVGRRCLIYFLMALIVCKLYVAPSTTIGSAFVMCILFIALSIVYTIFTARKVLIFAEPIKEKVKVGDKAKVKLKVRNESKLPVPYIYIYFENTEKAKYINGDCLCFNLGAMESKEIDIELQTYYRGSVSIRPSRIEIYDILEIFKKKIKPNWQVSFTVVSSLEKLGSKENNENEVNMRIGEDGAETDKESREKGNEISYDFEPYVQGESLKRINWKIVAQKGMYVMRERVDNERSELDCTIIMDPSLANMTPQMLYSLIAMETDITKLDAKKRQQLEKQIQKSQILQSDYAITRYTNYAVECMMGYLNHYIQTGCRFNCMIYIDNKWENIVVESKKELEDIDYILCNQYFTNNVSYDKINTIYSGIMVTANIAQNVYSRISNYNIKITQVT